MEAFMSTDISFASSDNHAMTDEEDLSSRTVGQTSKKQKWTEEEDKALIESVKLHGTSNWPLIASAISGRTGKQCRERWINQLNPALNKDDWSMQEDQVLIQQQRVYGNAWSKISHFLPGRSSNAVKNRWSWLVRHRLRQPRVNPTIPIQSGIFFPQRFTQPQSAHPVSYTPAESIWPSSDTNIQFSDPTINHPFSQGAYTPESGFESFNSFEDDVPDSFKQGHSFNVNGLTDDNMWDAFD